MNRKSHENTWLFFCELVLFLFVFSAYLLTLCPDIYTGDSPLLSTSSFALGLAHPPGYPLYVLTGKAFTLLPFGNIAFKLNLMSAFFGAVASWLVFKTVFVITRSLSAALFSAFVSAFIESTWLEAIKAEVYSLNSALVMLIFYLLVKALPEEQKDRSPAGQDKTGNMRYLYLSVFLLGLAMGNHHTVGFMVFPLAFVTAVVLLKGRGLLIPPCGKSKTFLFLSKQTVILFVFFLTGFSVYLLGLVRTIKASRGEILFNYANIITLKGFLNTFFRKAYAGVNSIDIITSVSPSSFSWLYAPYNIFQYILAPDLGYFLVLIPVSIIFLLQNRNYSGLFFFTGLSWLVILGGLLMAGKMDSEEANTFFTKPYFLPVNYFFSVLAGTGAFFILKLAMTRLHFLYRALSLGCILLPFVFLLPVNLKKNRLDDFHLISDFSKDMLNNLPPKSILLVNSDISYFPLMYGLLVERLKEDTIVVLTHKGGVKSDINQKWKYSGIFPEFFEERPITKGRINEMFADRGRLFAYGLLSQPDFIKDRYNVEPSILSFRLFPRTSRYDSGYYQNKFMADFGMFVYERAKDIRVEDDFSAQLKTNYFWTVNHYAYMLWQGGDKEQARHYYDLSDGFINPQSLKWYLNYLKFTGNIDEATVYLDVFEGEINKYEEAKKVVRELRRSLTH